MTIFFCNSQGLSDNFKEKQLQYYRVKIAYNEKEELLKAEFSKKKMIYPAANIFLRIFKNERILELWIKEKSKKKYKFFKSYEFAGFSGKLGPKLREGDGQIPEGYYYISNFNPLSNYHLSLKIDYPNNFDKKTNFNITNLGGDIFIHGSNVTIGCIPITDDKIKELYILAVEAKNAGQSNIPVHIFPIKLTRENFGKISELYKIHKNFWQKLKSGFDYFNTTNELFEYDDDYNICESKQR